MRIKEIKIYTFNELSEEAQEKALEKYRFWGIEYDQWYEFIYDDAIEIGKILGISIDKIYFSGFYSQGDGACFIGTYEYEKGSFQKIKEYAPQDKDLHEIALRLQQIQRPHFYELIATIKHEGHYYHEHCTDIRVYDNNEVSYLSYEEEEEVAEILRDFMVWIYRRLEKEYDTLINDKYLKEEFKEREVEFYKDGTMY